MGTRSAHERWGSRNESLHHHRGRECTVAPPGEIVARGPLKKEICPGNNAPSILQLFGAHALKQRV